MFGFYLAIGSSIVATILQWKIYQTSPCGFHATSCKIQGKQAVAPISLWAQAPIFILGAMSECFCQVTGYEIAYARSPKNMKALVMSIFLFMSALSAALGQIVTPFTKDPYLIYVWASPPVALFVLSFVFYWQFRWMNKDNFMTYEEEYEEAGVDDASPTTVEDIEKAKEMKP
jgi:dipeptide/tripeptide permease